MYTSNSSTTFEAMTRCLYVLVGEGNIMRVQKTKVDVVPARLSSVLDPISKYAPG